MLAAGIGSIDELGARARLQDVTLRRALATQGESLGFRQGLMLSRALGVRAHWLLDGNGPIAPVATGDPAEVGALMVLHAIPEGKVTMWINWGRRLIRD